MVVMDMVRDGDGAAGVGQAMDTVDRAKAGAGAVGDGQVIVTMNKAKAGAGVAGDGQAMSTTLVSVAVFSMLYHNVYTVALPHKYFACSRMGLGMARA